MLLYIFQKRIQPYSTFSLDLLLAMLEWILVFNRILLTQWLVEPFKYAIDQSSLVNQAHTFYGTVCICMTACRSLISWMFLNNYSAKNVLVGLVVYVL